MIILCCFLHPVNRGLSLCIIGEFHNRARRGVPWPASVWQYAACFLEQTPEAGSRETRNPLGQLSSRHHGASHNHYLWFCQSRCQTPAKILQFLLSSPNTRVSSNHSKYCSTGSPSLLLSTSPEHVSSRTDCQTSSALRRRRSRKTGGCLKLLKGRSK